MILIINNLLMILIKKWTFNQSMIKLINKFLSFYFFIRKYNSKSILKDLGNSRKRYGSFK